MKKEYSGSKLKIFASYIAAHKKAFLIDMVLSLLIASVDLVFPLVTRRSMQSLLPDQKYRVFFIVMAILFVAYLVRAFFQYLVTVIGHRMGTLVEADMRRDVFTHMQSLSYSFFDHHRTGVLLGRVTNDLFEIVELAHHGPENLLTCGFTIIGALIILLFINPLLTLVLIVLVPLLIWFSVRQRQAMQEAKSSKRPARSTPRSKAVFRGSGHPRPLPMKKRRMKNSTRRMRHSRRQKSDSTGQWAGSWPERKPPWGSCRSRS